MPEHATYCTACAAQPGTPCRSMLNGDLLPESHPSRRLDHAGLTLDA